MSTVEDIDELQRDVRYLMDRTAILDCIASHARGCDRHDAELLTSTYHSDGVDEHGHAINPGPEYDFFRQAGFSHGSRDKRDLSHQRPLALESPAPEHW